MSVLLTNEEIAALAVSFSSTLCWLPGAHEERLEVVRKLRGGTPERTVYNVARFLSYVDNDYSRDILLFDILLADADLADATA